MYEVKFYSGDYSDRQYAANRDKAICYIEQHLNSTYNDTTNYSLVVVGNNASVKSINMGECYARLISKAFRIPLAMNRGVVVGGFNGRGGGNLEKTNMPAVLLEPFFASSKCGGCWLHTQEGIEKLANAIVNMVTKHFPKGGLVAFSIGHKGKKSNPDDKGCNVYGGGFEADFCEQILLLAKEKLENKPCVLNW